MIIKNDSDYKGIRSAAKLSVDILSRLRDNLKVGVLPIDLDKLALELCDKHGVIPAFSTVPNYDYNSCISVNEDVLHGIPSDSRPIEEGDLVKIDFGVVNNGFYTDHCYTFSMGNPSEENERLISTGKLAVESSIDKAVAGNFTGDIGYTMQTISELAGYNVLKQYVGHAVGRSLWEDPQIPAYGEQGQGDVLVKDLVVCLEAQVVTGSDEVYIKDDEWTIATKDGSKGVMFEYMVIVGEDEPEVITDTRDWQTVIN